MHAPKTVDLSYWEEEIPASALETDWYETFAEWFGGFRAWTGLKQKAIAAKLGMGPSSLSIASKRQYATVLTAERIAKAFDVQVPARFITRDGRSPSKSTP